MGTVNDIYGPYYQEKGREIPRKSSLSPEATKLWREMEEAAHASVYQRENMTVDVDWNLEQAIERLCSHPGCSWKGWSKEVEAGRGSGSLAFPVAPHRNDCRGFVWASNPRAARIV